MEGDPSTIIQIVLLGLSFFFSLVFSTVTIVFKSVIAGPVSVDDEYMRYHASKIEAIMENGNNFSTTVLFGRVLGNATFTLCAFLLFSTFYPYADSLKRALIPLGASFLVLTLFSCNIPRALAKRFYRPFISFNLTVYNLTAWIFLPLVALYVFIHERLLKLVSYDERLAFLSDEEKAQISEENGSALDEEEREMIRRIFNLNEKTVDEIMVPRIDIQGFDLNTPVESILKMINDEGHSRLPVFKETTDSIVGILYVKDIVRWFSEHGNSEWNITKIIKKPLYIPMGKKVNDLMRIFKKQHMHFAIVVDEYGGTAGIVTMEDVLEEIVGDIQDEYDEEEKQVVKVSDNSYIIDPSVDIRELNEELDLNLDLEGIEYNTLSGLIYQEYGDVPQENTSFEYEGLRFKILKMDNQRIEKVRIDRAGRADVASDSVKF